MGYDPSLALMGKILEYTIFISINIIFFVCLTFVDFFIF